MSLLFLFWGSQAELINDFITISIKAIPRRRIISPGFNSSRPEAPGFPGVAAVNVVE